MRLIIVNYWSILLGFTITTLAFTGMLLAVFFPAAVAIDFSPNRSISALEVPIRNLETSSVETEVIVGSEVEPASAVEVEKENQQETPAQFSISLIPQTGAVQQSSSTTVSKPEDPLAYLPSPEVPMRVVIPSIDLNAPVVPAPVEFETIAGKEYLQWFVPDEYAIGWHTTSAMLGETGNTVLNGHHNAYGEVFVSLEQVNEGDIIWVEAGRSRFSYQITNKMILPEKYEQLDVRMNNAQWLLPTVDERLTLISCWPYESNTHRLIVVARPLGQEEISLSLE